MPTSFPNSLRPVLEEQLPADEVLLITLKFHNTCDTDTVVLAIVEALSTAYLLPLPLHFLHLPSSISLST